MSTESNESVKLNEPQKPVNEPQKIQPKVYCLSISGGGVRGIIPLYILYYLEQDLLVHHNKTIYETFDMFAGTSVGAIITGAIVYVDSEHDSFFYDREMTEIKNNKFSDVSLEPGKRKNMQDLLNNYFTDANFKNIFTKSSNISSYFGLGPKYDGTYKTNLITSAVGSKYQKDTDKKTLFTVYSCDEQKPRFFKNYDDKKDHITRSSRNSSENTRISEIIDASSAAPSYFPSVKFYDSNGLHYGVDGALFANNPTACMYADALKIYGSGADIKILSIGTGDNTQKYHFSETQSWGPLQWVIKGSILDILMEVDENMVDYITSAFVDGSGHSYYRIQEPVHISLDDISKIQELKEIARKWYMKHRDNLLKFFE